MKYANVQTYQEKRWMSQMFA